MSESPWTGGGPEVSVTLKQSKDFSAPWIVIRGETIDQVRQATAEVAGLDAGDLPLTAVVHNVADHFQRVGTMGTQLGATVISSTPAEKPAQEPAEAPQAAEQPAPAPEVDLEQEIAATDSVSALGDLYLRHEDAFKADAELLGKLQAKVTKLKG